MYAEIEQAIVDRLVARMPQGTHVGVLRDVATVPELRQKAPAVWVVYDGYRVGDRLPAQSGVCQVVQEWFVVVAAKSARGQGGVDEARDAAGALCEQVLQALLGFHLGGGRYLRLEEAPGPEYDAGYCHVPLAFSNAATFKGTP
jgi:phage gp37-like protein